MRVLYFSDGVSPLYLLLLLQAALGSYVLTTPRKWAAGSRAQICMTVDGGDGTVSPQDEIRIKVYTMEQRPYVGGWGWGGVRDVAPPSERTLLISEKVLKPHSGLPMTCDQLSVPDTSSTYGQVEIQGELGGVSINETRDINIAINVGQTFVQTDKYLYKAGQKVQFRVLTLDGPFFRVSTEPYPEIFVESPSGSRIAQWLDVPNPSGLIHLDMQLIDEPEEGIYYIKARSIGSAPTVSKSFKIEDYVLPRFEVKIKTPNYLLADAELLTFEVCATYTFGQPVKGNVSVNLHNNGWGRYKLEMNFLDQVNGCKKLQIPLRTFDVNNRNYFVYSISADVTVEEEGTGTTVKESASVSIIRTVLTMRDVQTSSYRKPELPYTQAIKIEFPDGSPGSDELMSVCVGDVCKNLKSDAAGILRYTVPPHLNTKNAKVTALNYPRRTLPETHRAYMYESTYNAYGKNYYSPTNSSINIMPDSTKLECTPGLGTNLRLPILYAAVNMTDTLLYVQVISRGQIQYWDTQSVRLAGSELAVNEESLVEAMQPPYSPFTVLGTVYLTIPLPSTVSPNVKVVVWYNRPDGEVVADAREIEITKCLDHKVELSWPKEKVEQGTTLPLTLTAQPSSLCSLGIVDKSVELLSSQQDSLTLDKIFALADRVTIQTWENSQINDAEYCKNKNPPKPVVPPTPLMLTVENIGDTSVTLSWTTRYTPGAGDTIIYVEYKSIEDGGDGVPLRMDLGTSRIATIRGLESGTTYEFRVIASNKIGESEPSRPVIAFVKNPEPEVEPLMNDAPEPVSAAGVEELGAPDEAGDVKPPPPSPVGLDDADGSSFDGATERKKRSIMPTPRYRTSLIDALHMFDESGLHVLSDLTLETRPCKEYNYGYEMRYHSFGAPGLPGPMVNNRNRIFAAPAPPMFASVPMRSSNEDAPISLGDGLPEPESRVYFPETWLWELMSLDSETGSLVQDLTLPDTITEWVGRAVCVHPTKGLGISGTTSITTFTPFFVDLTVLPSVKKGEIMPIIISIFNYEKASLPVRVSLEASPDYEILGAEGTEAAPDQAQAGVRSVCVPTNDKQTITVRVRPMAVGDVNLTVSAVVDAGFPEECGPEVIINKVDRIISPIKVEYEGFPREKTWTKYICTADLNENAEFAEEWHMEAPVGIVPESERAWVTVVGDLLGPTLENLGNLIKMPYGCGEQNMLNFAPNIYVHQYLTASGQGNDAVYEKLKKFMRSGYQRELNYKHSDGSYSAFGESDDSGSTWLTAFVVKSFAQARPYISIDATLLDMSTEWLVRRQLENGCFQSVGKVLHKGMKGGAAEGASPGVLTSYVMAALLEAGQSPGSEAISNAVYCLQATTKTGANIKPYETALKTYAYSLARLPEALTTLNDLLSLAVDSPEGLYWDVPNSQGSHHRGSDSNVNPVSVEIAGYALMSMMMLDPEAYSTAGHRIVKWISEQRNSQGGFISTQDTVVALQALALYESHQTQEPLDLMVSVIGDQLSETFKVTESNKLLTQRVEVPTVPMNIMIDMAGTGCTLVQGVVRYNVKDPEPSEAFKISVTTSNDYSRNSCKSKKIRTCASYLLNDLASNMAVIEVTLVSGYIPEKSDLKRVVGYGTGIIKRYEVDGSKVLFYVDQFTEQETCVEFGVLKEVAVENPKDGTVKVYDYYEPEFAVSETYTLPRRFDCDRRFTIDEIFGDDIIPPPPLEPVPLLEEGAPPAIPLPQLAVDELVDALDDLP